MRGPSFHRRVSGQSCQLTSANPARLWNGKRTHGGTAGSGVTQRTAYKGTETTSCSPGKGNDSNQTCSYARLLFSTFNYEQAYQLPVITDRFLPSRQKRPKPDPTLSKQAEPAEQGIFLKDPSLPYRAADRITASRRHFNPERTGLAPSERHRLPARLSPQRRAAPP